MGPATRWLIRLVTLVLIVLAINQAFNFSARLGHTLIEQQYLYTVLMFTIPVLFLTYPLHATRGDFRPTLLDWGLAALSVGCLGFFIYHSYSIISYGWEMQPPRDTVIVGAVLWALGVEASRRAGGWILAGIVLLFSTYPLYADMVPGPISAFASPFEFVAGYHAMSLESMMGIPLRAFANLVFGFILFGVALEHTGAGRFFINLAFALLGHVRGGPAKVSIISSGLMGSLSGSVVTNVMTTGVMTIPAMRRSGMKGVTAAGIETCASTGGVLMPPVMGAAAFVMASFLQTSYSSIALAAAIPAFLYFFGLFIQIDARAARDGLSGLPAAELPSLRQTLKEGWHHIFAIALLIFMLLWLRREALAPYHATAVLLIVNQVVSRKYRWGLREVWAFVDSAARLFANLAGILAGVGMIIGGLSFTGLAGTLVNDLLFIAGGEPYVLLVMGAVTSLILGVGMPATACYIFLAIMLAPALVQAGLEPMAVHLFIFYWGMLSYITPPLALGAFAAASVAQTPPMQTGFESMKIGSVIYFIPFFFVLDPGLILVGAWPNVVLSICLAIFGVFVFASAIQGYMPGIGRLFGGGYAGPLLRLPVLAGAILIALPGEGIPGWSDIELLSAGLALILPFLAAAFAVNRRARSGSVLPGRSSERA
ncbi:TRAP transporter fused permease subunit [Psychromarinibacter sp. C21-152]|uniref:TRAP transporter fused permease subunit n=1 Tax=Psychromarinibacter sediminicola TaxID=3033385 RepID=A0AAE3NU56_9RHOB|nr:TRAP transporter fused permease subunit [Psychromarinibacter sediminicola]MDF0601724.1 TRAP transporter fused permease subunit [Psychromarinibacter sediminicola]